MVILGIDPGTATTGWGVIDRGQGSDTRDQKKKNNESLKLVDFGCIITKSGDEMGERLLILNKALEKVIKTYNPDCVVIERLFFGRNVTSALSVGQARGIILLAAAESKVPVFEYTGLQVKLTVADHGRADKLTVQKAVKKHLNVTNLRKPKNQQGKSVFSFRDDAYDAVAAAICHVLKAVSSKQ